MPRKISRTVFEWDFRGRTGTSGVRGESYIVVYIEAVIRMLKRLNQEYDIQVFIKIH